MDQDQKLIIFLDSLGPDADIDFAKQILQAHEWDLQAALETVTGGVAAPSAEAMANEEVRAPIRTGYVDRLIDTSHEEDQAAVLAASESFAMETSARQDLEDALRASEEEFLRQADIQEQAALAAAMEASYVPVDASSPQPVSGPGRRATPSYPEPGNFHGRVSPGAVPELNPLRRLNGQPAAPRLVGESRSPVIAPFASSKFSTSRPEKVSDEMRAGREASRLESFEEKEKPRKAARTAEESEKTKMPKYIHKVDISTSEVSQNTLERSSEAKVPRQGTGSTVSGALPTGSISHSKVGVQRQPIFPGASSGTAGRMPQNKVEVPRQSGSSSVSSGKSSIAANGASTVQHNKAGALRQPTSSTASSFGAAAVSSSIPDSKVGALRQPSSSGKPSVAASGAGTVQHNKAGSLRQPTSSTASSFGAAAVSSSIPDSKVGALRQPSSSGKPSVAASGAGTVQHNKAGTASSTPSSGVAAVGSSIPDKKVNSSTPGTLSSAPMPSNPLAQGDEVSEAVVQAAERFAAKEAEELRREREEAEAKRREAEACDPRENDAVVSALQALRRLHLKRNPVELATCLQTLRAYINNLAKNPQEVKYQSIKCDNTHFCNKIASVEGAVAVLEACGFVSDGNKLSVDPDFMKTKGPKLWEALSKVDLILEQVKSAT